MLLAVCVLMSSGLALGPQFNPRDVVRQIRHPSSTPSVVDCGLFPDDGEFLIDTSVGLAPREQEWPHVASDGASFLVTWVDYRSGTSYDIYGARVAPGGAVLDPTGILIATGVGSNNSPCIACDGASFLIAWSNGDIYGARVTPGGVVLDTAGIAISAAVNDEMCSALAFDGANYFVTWLDYRNGDTADIYGARVTPEGIVLDSSGLPISTAANGQWYQALAFGDSGYLLTWQDGRNGTWDIYGARVTPGGTVLDTTGIAVSTGANAQQYPAVAFDSANFLVVWEDYRSGSHQSDIYGARVTPGGAVLDPWGIPITTAAYYQEEPAVAFGGTNYLVTWTNDHPGSDHNIYGARATPAGTVLDPLGIPISTSADWQECSAVGFDGTNFLVTWEDYRSGLYSICGARVTPGGTVLDPSGIAISTDTNGQSSPALGFDGANFLVTWEDCRNDLNYGDIYGARVTPGGAVLDSSGIPISTVPYYQEEPALAFDGANFLVTWMDGRGPDYDIYAARVTPAGTVLDPWGIPISTSAGNQEYPALTFDGTNYLVVWMDSRSGSWDIYGARVTLAGEVFDSGIVVHQDSGQLYPGLCHGSAPDRLLVYQGWAGVVGGMTYNASRVWGKLNPNPAIVEMTEPEVRMTNGGATIVRSVLFLPEASGHKPLATCLLDVSGRKVMDLRPGANDVRALAPGVYFVREARAQAQALAVRKVVLTE